MTHKEEIKEEFCPVCVLAPLAFSGAGAAVYGKSQGGKNLAFYIGIAVTIISILLGIYFLRKNGSDCAECSSM